MRSPLLRTGALLLTSLLGLASPAAPLEPDAHSLKETNRVLEEELKLASRPLLYLIVDLSEGVVRIKGRGIELHRMTITAWSCPDTDALHRVFRLQARPNIARPRTLPEGDPDADPISLQDMPMDYDLQFDPPLTVAIAPPARERPLLLAKSLAREWWSRAASYLRRDPHVGRGGPPRLRLSLPQDATQSLAWSLTDGMPLLIRTPR